MRVALASYPNHHGLCVWAAQAMAQPASQISQPAGWLANKLTSKALVRANGLTHICNQMIFRSCSSRLCYAAAARSPHLAGSR